MSEEMPTIEYATSERNFEISKYIIFLNNAIDKINKIVYNMNVQKTNRIRLQVA